MSLKTFRINQNVGQQNTVQVIKKTTSSWHTNAESLKSNITQKPTRLDTSRLKPMRELTKHAIVNILTNGTVCLEFMNRSLVNVLKVEEVITISSNGQIIEIHEVPQNTFTTLSEDALSNRLMRRMQFNYSNLPSHYFKKYQYASKFINVVRSKTPKLTLYTKRAKCVLMENGPSANFEVTFYDKQKVILCATTGANIVSNHGNIHIRKDSDLSVLDQVSKELLDFAQKCRKTCLQVESSLIETMSSSDVFPITLERKPVSIITKKNVTRKICDESATSTHSASCESHQNAKLDNSSLSTLSSSLNNQSRRATVLCKVFVAGVGWGVQMSSGEVQIQFLDGCELTVCCSPLLVTCTEQHGARSTFTDKDVLPSVVQQRLQALPIITAKFQQRLMSV